MIKIIKQAIELDLSDEILLKADKIYVIKRYMLQELYWRPEALEELSEVLKGLELYEDFVKAIEDLPKRQVQEDFMKIFEALSARLNDYDVIFHHWTLKKHGRAIVLSSIDEGYEVASARTLRLHRPIILLDPERVCFQLPSQLLKEIRECWEVLQVAIYRSLEL